MNTTNLLPSAKFALAPARKAIIDALLLGSFINWILLMTSVLFSFPWLFIVVYALAYLLAFTLRLRHAVRQLAESRDYEDPLEEAHRELASPRTFIGLALFWGNRPF